MQWVQISGQLAVVLESFNQHVISHLNNLHTYTNVICGLSYVLVLSTSSPSVQHFHTLLSAWVPWQPYYDDKSLGGCCWTAGLLLEEATTFTTPAFNCSVISAISLLVSVQCIPTSATWSGDHILFMMTLTDFLLCCCLCCSCHAVTD